MTEIYVENNIIKTGQIPMQMYKIKTRKDF